MMNSYNNPWESEEKRRQRQAREQMRRQKGLQVSPQNGSFGASGERIQAQQNGFGTPQQQQTPLDTPQQQQQQNQTPTPWANQSQNQTPQFDNTRDAVAYAWDKQHPYGGTTKMTGPLGDISYYDENLYKPKEPNIPAPIADQQQKIADQTQDFYGKKYDNINPVWESAKNIKYEDIKEGLGLGLEKAINGLTLDGYSWVDKKLGGNYKERNDLYHQNAQQADIGKLAEYNDKMLDFATSNLGVAKIAGKYLQNPASKSSAWIANDILGSATANMFRNDDFSGDAFAKGGRNSNSLQLLKLLEEEEKKRRRSY